MPYPPFSSCLDQWSIRERGKYAWIPLKRTHRSLFTLTHFLSLSLSFFRKCRNKKKKGPIFLPSEYRENAKIYKRAWQSPASVYPCAKCRVRSRFASCSSSVSGWTAVRPWAISPTSTSTPRISRCPSLTGTSLCHGQWEEGFLCVCNIWYWSSEVFFQSGIG